MFGLWSLWGAGLTVSVYAFLLMIAVLPLYWWAQREGKAALTLNENRVI